MIFDRTQKDVDGAVALIETKVKNFERIVKALFKDDK